MCSVALIVATPLLCAIRLGVALTSAGQVIFARNASADAACGSRCSSSAQCTSVAAALMSPPKRTRGLRRSESSFGKASSTSFQNCGTSFRDLSLVGPRPERFHTSTCCVAWQEVLRVRPGITDPMLRLRNEEDLLAASGRPGNILCDFLLPSSYTDIKYVSQRTWKRDVAVVADVVGDCVPTRVLLRRKDRLVV